MENEENIKQIMTEEMKVIIIIQPREMIMDECQRVHCHLTRLNNWEYVNVFVFPKRRQIFRCDDFCLLSYINVRTFMCDNRQLPNYHKLNSLRIK